VAGNTVIPLWHVSECGR